MTEALDAMVRAMVEELGRQALHEAEGFPVVSRPRPEEPHSLYVDGRYDFAKVARAGLEAIREPVLGALHERKALYDAKADKRDPLAEDDLNRHDLAVHASEAMDYAAADVAAMFDKIREQKP